MAPQGYPYIVDQMKGMLFDVDVSNDEGLHDMTKRVLEVSKYKPQIAEQPRDAPRPGANPIPSRLGDASPIKDVLYIIKENRTYDQLFGDLTKDGKPYGNGDPRLTPALAETPTGRIWDHVRHAGLSYRTYYYHTTDHLSQEWADARAKGVRDYEAADIFIREFKDMEHTGTVPRFMIMALSEDHTKGTRPGVCTPKACVASNDLGIGKIVEAISESSLWKDFAIFIIEDDAQNGPDHVDSHRTVGLVVSPYTRNTGVDHTHYTTTSMLRTIELLLGATPMSQFDAAATPMYGAFHNVPNLASYTARTPATDLAATNAAVKESPLLQAIDYSEPDQLSVAQEIALNQAIWRSVKGKTPYPGAVRRFGSAPADDEDDDKKTVNTHQATRGSLP